MVQVKSVQVGVGMPKICVPIVEKSQEQILEKAQEILQESVDLIEWRADFFDESDDLHRTAQTAGLLQSILGKIPLLFTFRTAREGGEKSITFEYRMKKFDLKCVLFIIANINSLREVL